MIACSRAVCSASLSARRAWIEIGVVDFAPGEVFVALRKESVDRNLLRGCRDSVFERVALRKESVDRNRKYLFLEAVSMGRSPQGERG